MRAASLLLLVVLTAPSVATVVCSLTCVHGASVDRAVAPTPCHDQRSGSDGGTAMSGLDAFCHDQTDEVVATAPATPQLSVAPAAAQWPGVFTSGLRHNAFAVPDPAVSPPDIRHTTIPLRI
jgi:hypothetical protein